MPDNTCPSCGCTHDDQHVYTHIVKRASGYVAGWFGGPDAEREAAEFAAECNRHVPGDPAEPQELDWAALEALGQAEPHEPDPYTAGVVGAPQPDVHGRRAEVAAARDGRCWNDFCIATDCDGRNHVDATGYGWSQEHGTRYCAQCAGYVAGCGHQELVTTLYERTGTMGSERELREALGAPYEPNTPEYRAWGVAQRNGANAAGWVFDGNTTQETYRRFLRGIEDGDPEVLDSVRTPDLSGEFGDDYSEADLLSDVGYVPHDGTDHANDLAEQYNREVSQAFWAEIERQCLRNLPHRMTDSYTQLGNRFITCACGHRVSGGLGDTIAQQNFDHHLRQAREAKQQPAT